MSDIDIITDIRERAAIDEIPPEHKVIPLVEMFGPTIQGEGTVIGQQTFFLRFGACDYRCSKCDSLHAVLPQLIKKNAEYLTQQDIFDKFFHFAAQKIPSTDWVTFSGGNPAVHNLGHLLGLFKVAGWKINVETQGTFYRGWLNKVDSLTISPKGPGMGIKHDQKIFMGFIDKVYQNGQFAGAHPGDAIPEWFGPNLCIKIVVFDQRDLDFAALIFQELADHPLFAGKDTSNHFYLSLGNPYPPLADDKPYEFDHEQHMRYLLADYKRLYEDIQRDRILRNVRFLPQWHFFVWGNDKGH